MKKLLFSIVSAIRSLVARLFGRSEMYYINGSQTLPAPLSAEEEALLVERAKTDLDARNTLVERNLRLVVYIARKFDNTGSGIEDLISIGTIGLMKAVASFCPDKNIKLATYASRCIENEILMHIRKYSGTRSEVSIDDPLSVDWDGNELLLSDLLGTEEDCVFNSFEEKEERRAVRSAIARLKRRDRDIIILRFGLNDPDGREMTQKEVADLLGISQSYISRLEKRIIARLREELT